ncbi:hypothetical protein RP20_CCG020172 [Aedes albopictus]|nr:hypothetical protein RP20_CCG020172 [Aedes albopictus]
MLQLCLLAAMLGCCAGFAIPQQPGQYYDYGASRWQPQSYQSLPSQYEPYQYKPYDYDSSYYSNYYSGYYYYPYVYAHPESHKNEIPTLHHGQSCGKAEELLKVCRTVRKLLIAQIEKERLGGYKPEMKQDVEDLSEDLESRHLDDVAVDDNGEVIPEDNQTVEALNELITALEIYLQQQKLAEEREQDAVGQLDSMTSTTSSPLPVASAEGSWFGSMFGKGSDAADKQTVGADSKPVMETGSKPSSGENAWVHEDVVEKNPHDFDIDERFQTATNSKDLNSASTVTQSVPLWLTEKTEQLESKELVPDVLTTKEIEIYEQLPESRQDPEDVDDVQAEHHQSEVTTTDESTSTSSTDTTDEVSSSTTTAATTPDARSFVKEQILNVLRLLEEAKGYTEIKEHISNPDVDQLVDGLADVEAGVRWTEMLTALQNLVADKQLDRAESIVNVLEHWKKGAKGQLDNGYFNRTYGASPDVEARGLDEEREAPKSVDVVDNFTHGTYGSNNKTSNETRVPIMNETYDQIISHVNATAAAATAEERGPRIINVDVTPISTPVEEPSSTETSKQQEAEASETDLVN